jgi:hypothetical protein
MNHDQTEFEQLRRLLALKRYEQPPPGYFNSFSGQVITQIRAGEGREAVSLSERLSLEAPWLQRIWAALESNPVLAGGVAVIACGLLIAGIVLTERPTGNIPEAPGSPFAQFVDQPATTPGLSSPAAVEFSSMAGVASQPQGSLVNAFPRPERAQPVVWRGE